MADLPPGPQSVAAQAGASANPVNSPTASAADGTPPGPPPSLAVNDDARGVVGQVRFPSDTPMYYMSLGINQYQRKSWASVGQLSQTDTIVMPLPEQLVDSQHVTYDTVPIGIPGMATMAALGSGGGADVGNIKNAINQTVSAVAQGAAATALGSLQKIEGLIGGVATTGISAGFLASQGLAVNDYLTVLLRGPAYKQFTFTWKMSPRNAAESRSIKAIEILLKNAQAPGRQGSIGAFFTWPRIFNIKFRYAAEGSGNSDFMSSRLFKFKPAVLTDLAVSYAPGGVPAFYGQTQYPEGIMLQMQFTELELWVNSSGDAQDAYGDPEAILGSTAASPLPPASVNSEMGAAGLPTFAGSTDSTGSGGGGH